MLKINSYTKLFTPSTDRLLASYTPAARFDAATNLLSIPLARAFGQDYQAQFKYLGDSLFQLQSANPK
ncbi:MAG: hypothetical protein QX197_10130 [Methylococcaceae bacterium]